MSFKLSRESLHPKFPPPRENKKGEKKKTMALYRHGKENNKIRMEKIWYGLERYDVTQAWLGGMAKSKALEKDQIALKHARKVMGE